MGRGPSKLKGKYCTRKNGVKKNKGRGKKAVIGSRRGKGK